MKRGANGEALFSIPNCQMMQIGVEKHVFGSGVLEHFAFFVLICVCLQQLLWPIDENNFTIF